MFLEIEKKCDSLHKAQKQNSTSLPAISVVIIGLNVERFLQKCILSVLNANYPKEKLELIYVDSGSTDKSLEIAKCFTNLRIIELDVLNPSAAMGRNAGYRAAVHQIVHFVDADSYLHPDWLKEAITFLKDDVAAVAGELKERYPDRNLYHRISNLEWNLRNGKNGWTTSEIEAKIFGGNVMILKDVLQATGGYDESIPAGEDPELSYRVRKAGLKILRLNLPMASHDINLANFRQYFKRSKRSGYAYAQIAAKHWRNAEKNMTQPLIRIIAGTITPLAIVLSGIVSGHLIIGLTIAFLVSFRLLLKVNDFARIFSISFALSLLYSLHLAFVIYPQFIGMTQGFWHAITKNVDLKK